MINVLTSDGCASSVLNETCDLFVGATVKDLHVPPSEGVNKTAIQDELRCHTKAVFSS